MEPRPEVSFCQIFDYIGDKKRCLKEGEEVLKAGYIVACGIKEEKEGSVVVHALCVQTSGIRGNPHQVEACVKKDTFTVTCSCKAGLSGYCKHCIALLLYVHKQTLTDLELLSCTDLTQRWGTSSRRGLHAPAPLEEQCHFRELMVDGAVQQVCDKDTVLQQLLAAAPDSGLALPIQGRKNAAKAKADSAGLLCCLRSIATKEVVVSSMQLVMPPPSDVGDFYWQHVDMSAAASADLCEGTRDQTGHQWKSARRVRITASEAHQWYTYEGDSWDSKVERHFTSQFSGSMATRYGQDNEKPAILAYQKQQGEQVTTCGLMVPPGAPWLGCSPDGVVCDDGGVPVKLLEVKCPVMGKERTSQDMTCSPPSFLEACGENIVLKRRNRYFSQVQLAMAILNVNVCDLAVCSKADDRVLVVRVPRDRAYGRGLLDKLHRVYFTYILSRLTKDLTR